MQRRQRVALITGTLVLLFVFVAVGRLGLPWSGAWQVLVEVVAGIAVVVAAALLTRHWLAPTLVGSGILLSTLGLAWIETAKATQPDQAAFLLGVLSVVLSLIASLFLFLGAWIMFRALLRHWG